MWLWNGCTWVINVKFYLEFFCITRKNYTETARILFYSFGYATDESRYFWHIEHIYIVLISSFQDKNYRYTCGWKIFIRLFQEYLVSSLVILPEMKIELLHEDCLPENSQTMTGNFFEVVFPINLLFYLIYGFSLISYFNKLFQEVGSWEGVINYTTNCLPVSHIGYVASLCSLVQC